MRLSEDQQKAVRTWAAEGATLGDIQKRLEEEFSVNITYMEARFLISDLNVTLIDKDREPQKDLSGAAAPGGEEGAEFAEDDDFGNELADEPSFAGGTVTVTIDHITKPSAMISGKTTFSDGETADWQVDQMGQLALNPSTRGYRPTQEDFIAFQRELQTAARKAGY